MSTSAINKFRLAVREFDEHRGDTDILTVTRFAGEAWKDAMLAEGRLSNNTIGQRIVNIGTVCGWAQRQGHIPEDTLRNPLHDVEQPEYELRRRPSLWARLVGYSRRPSRKPDLT